MAHLKCISFPDDLAPPILNYFAKYPDICISKLVTRLLLKHIKENDPELLNDKSIQKEGKITTGDYIETLVEAVHKTVPSPRIGYPQLSRANAELALEGHHKMTHQQAKKKLNEFPDTLLRRQGIEWESGFLIPFKPYFSNTKKETRSKGA